MPKSSEPPKSFISYTWDSPQHKKWVRELATRLRKNGVDVVLDQWDLEYGTDLPHFMETSVRESDFVILVCTPEYAKKANAGKGGAGYEKRIVTGEMFQNTNQSKFIPLVRWGSNNEALPTFLQYKNYIDFRNDPEFGEKLKDLLHQLHSMPKYPRPKLGPNPFSSPKVGKERPQTRESHSTEGEWDIEEKFEIEGDDYHEIPVELKAGDRLLGFVEANGKVSTYLLGTSSLRSFDDKLGFNYEWGREDPITSTKISYEATETRTFHFVVSNGYEDEDGDEYEPVSVEVKLRIQTPDPSDLDRPILE